VALPKPYRLPHARAFSTVYQQGRRASSKHLTLRVLQKVDSAAAGGSQFGFVVSQKVSKRAVVRNRLKRQVKAAVQALLPRLKSGFWVVVILRPGSIECDYEQFLRELEQLLTELEVIDGHSRGGLL
jgi:ribonuclease P protein component